MRTIAPACGPDPALQGVAAAFAAAVALFSLVWTRFGLSKPKRVFARPYRMWVISDHLPFGT